MRYFQPYPSILIQLILLLVIITSNGCQLAVVEDPHLILSSGEITENQDKFGLYYLYRPTNPSNPPQILVVIHGTPPPSESVNGDGGLGAGEGSGGSGPVGGGGTGFQFDTNPDISYTEEVGFFNEFGWTPTCPPTGSASRADTD